MNKNSLYLYKSPNSDEICVAVGSVGVKRRVYFSEDDALQLAYRLMSLARGGETQGLEKVI